MPRFYVLASLLLCSACDGSTTCATGERRACFCGDAPGLSTCADGAFGACACDAADGGTSADAGADAGMDASTDAGRDAGRDGGSTDAGRAEAGSADAAGDAGSGAPDSGTADATAPPPDAASGCDFIGYLPAETRTEASAAEQWLVHTMTTPDEILYVELFFASGASDTPHSLTFTPINYADCHTCLLMGAECAGRPSCATSYLAQAGTVTFTSLGRTHLTGTLENVRMIEVRLDPVTFVSTPVPGGRVWCIPSLAFTGP